MSEWIDIRNGNEVSCVDVERGVVAKQRAVADPELSTLHGTFPACVRHYLEKLYVRIVLLKICCRSNINSGEWSELN